MTLDDLVVCDLDGNVVGGPPRPDDREGAAPRGAAPLPRDQRDHALPRQALHDVRAHPPADPGGDRGVRGVRRRRRAGAPNYKTTGTDELAEEVAETGRRPQRGAHGQPRPVRGGQEPGRRRCTSRGWSSAPPRSCGAPSAWARSCRCPRETNTPVRRLLPLRAHREVLTPKPPREHPSAVRQMRGCTDGCSAWGGSALAEQRQAVAEGEQGAVDRGRRRRPCR